MDPTTISTISTTIASNGLLGSLLVTIAWAYWSKDRELKAERDARIADAKSYMDLTLKLQAQVIDSINKVSEIFDEMKKHMSPAQSRIVGGSPR